MEKGAGMRVFHARQNAGAYRDGVHDPFPHLINPRLTGWVGFLSSLAVFIPDSQLPSKFSIRMCVFVNAIRIPNFDGSEGSLTFHRAVVSPQFIYSPRSPLTFCAKRLRHVGVLRAYRRDLFYMASFDRQISVPI